MYREIRDEYENYGKYFTAGYMVLYLIGLGLLLYGHFTGNIYQQYLFFEGLAMAGAAFVSLIDARAGAAAWCIALLYVLFFMEVPVSPETERMMRLDPEAGNTIENTIMLILWIAAPLSAFARLALRKEEEKAIRLEIRRRKRSRMQSGSRNRKYA